MITPEMVTKASRGYWDDDDLALRYDAIAAPKTKEILHKHIEAALSAVYSDIRRQAFAEAQQEIAAAYLLPDEGSDRETVEAYGAGMFRATRIVRALAGKETRE